MSSQADPSNMDHHSVVFEDDTSDSDDSESSTSSSETDEPVDPQTELCEDLESQLLGLTLEAQTVITGQPRATQLQLIADTRNLFRDYMSYGSMARLTVGIEKFFRLGDQGGKLIFEDSKEEIVLQGRMSDRRIPAHYGSMWMVNYTADDDKCDCVDKIDSDAGIVNGSLQPNPQSIFRPLRIIDPDSISYVTTLPWDPLATIFAWPGNLMWPRGLLGTLNQILSIEDYECRVRLFHYVTKYGPSPVFRLGIAQQVQNRYGSILETGGQNYLGLTQETRSFLRSVFESKPTLNIPETRLLARACGVDEDSLDMFWEDLQDETMGCMAMKAFIAAREAEKAKEAENVEMEKKKGCAPKS
ncbi:uncharacterized protein Z518_06549 [Rhinocladiella mackenziei CBS 650.93]|uniref:Uncharacterized protein n=1 Tax=Rhinocladiella mackenziei CBS 650.93 TaxID=1442369 RepID=A0A0D2IB19_9EURO|nr:uncharacterized protein Z518_06549 [Rhinocladiella mackenziei CBS 650.93]KIX02999.1 hypothetical protein Z518_06549 [Rhinocladiella mackenziei CBS 650.93]